MLQTYDAESIRKWLDEGNITCPQTGEDLSIPIQNRIMKTIIGDWCKANQNSFFQEMEQVSTSEHKTLYDRDFRCPLSGKMMINPVVVASGQVGFSFPLSFSAERESKGMCFLSKE